MNLSAGKFLAVGVEYDRAPFLRPLLRGDESDIVRLLARIKSFGFSNAMVVITHEGCEFWCLISDSVPVLFEAVTIAFAEAAGLESDELRPFIKERSGIEGLRHAFAVMAALDNPKMNSRQRLAEIETCYRLAERMGTISLDLSHLLQAGFKTATKIQSETRIHGSEFSMVESAMGVLRRMHGDIRRQNALLFGDGEMGVRIQQEMTAIGLNRWAMIHPKNERAKAWAELHGYDWLAFDRIADALVRADLVVSSLDLEAVTVTADAVKVALKQRRQKPILFIDAAIPGDIDKKVNEIEDAYLYTLEDLEALTMAGRLSEKRKNRAQEKKKALAIVEKEINRLQGGQESGYSLKSILQKLKRFFSVTKE